VVLSAAGFAHPAAAKPAVTHCVVTVEGAKPSGELVTSAPRCFATIGEALRSAGLPVVGSGDTPRQMAASGQMATASDYTIGIHYDGFGYTGSSFSVVGSGCIGGYLNMSSAWNNRVSSTWNGCPKIRHWAGVNMTSISESVYSPGGNLTTLNNETSSIQYLT
jgi:hypothetical protein